MKNIVVYDDSATILAGLAEQNETTIAEIIEEMILDHGEEYEVKGGAYDEEN